MTAEPLAIFESDIADVAPVHLWLRLGLVLAGALVLLGGLRLTLGLLLWHLEGVAGLLRTVNLHLAYHDIRLLH